MSRPPTVPVLTAEQSAAWDARAREDAGIPGRVLMESAGRAAARVIAARMGGRLERGVLLAAGPGNNGGDGWVVARALRALGVRVYATEHPRERSADCDANRTLALAADVEPVGEDASWPAVGLVVDALLGTGATGAPRGPLGVLATRIAGAGVPVAAIDGPTGLDLTSGEAHGPVRADLTVTFGGVRRGHLLAREWCGTVVAVDIGFPAPDPAWPALVTDTWARAHLPPFDVTMHKGDRGKLLVIGGEEGMAGAAMHVARAAFACGAGLVKLALAPASVRAAQTNFPDALTVSTALGPDVEPELAETLDWADAVVLGPGLGRGRARTAFARAVLERLAVPAVIDADALQVPRAASIGTAPRVLTPHPGEFSAQFPDLDADPLQDPFDAAPAAAAAAAAPAAVLLKGQPTVIAGGEGSRVVAAGNPALATGGSGDLLAGCIGVLLARGLPPLDAAALGAQTLGRAAERAAARYTVRATRPEQVAAAFPDLWRAWQAPLPVDPPVLAVLEPPAVQ